MMLIPAEKRLDADTPPEKRGQMRDGVRLLTYWSDSGRIVHGGFPQLANQLEAGDVLVFNNSRTIPAELKTVDGIRVRLSREVEDGIWDGLILGESSKKLEFMHGLKALVTGPGTEPPLVRLVFSCSSGRLLRELYRQGDVIRYEHVARSWPLQDYQTVYASIPGSVEMPSAGRAFTWRMLANLQKHGIRLAFVTLHAGLSYYGDDKWPNPALHPEAFSIEDEQAAIINDAKANGGRVIAVGTTVVRALETASDGNTIIPQAGVTSLYLSRTSKLTAVDGLLTGFHEQEASHIDLLQTFAGEEGVKAIYKEAVAKCYLWHEFGDMNLIMKQARS